MTALLGIVGSVVATSAGQKIGGIGSTVGAFMVLSGDLKIYSKA